MKYISTFINEAKGSEEFFRSCKAYLSKLEGKLPQNVILAARLIERYGIDDPNAIQELLGTKSKVAGVAKRYGLALTDVENLAADIKKINDEGNLRLIPMMQTDLERQDLMNAKRDMEDITMDLETEKGREAVVKKYAGLAQAIAKKYINKSNFSLEELYSSALLGLSEAINQYRKPADASEKHLTFKQYAGWKIKQRILLDISDLSRVVRRPRSEISRAKDNGGIKSDISLNTQTDDEFNPSSLERRYGLIANDDTDLEDTDDSKWLKIYQVIDQQFSKRDADIFYRTFGVNGRKQEKSVTIAKELGVSKGRITQVIQKIINVIKENPKTRYLLRDLAKLYTESIMVAGAFKDRETIIEMFANDDIYCIVEQLTRFSDKDVLESTLNSVLARYNDETLNELSNLITDNRKMLDEKYNTGKALLIDFLENMCPDMQYRTMSDMDIMENVCNIAIDMRMNNIKF